MKLNIIKSGVSKVAVLATVITITAGCASRSPVAREIINIQPQYADKMAYSTLEATGFQQSFIVDGGAFAKANSVILNVVKSDPKIENNFWEKFKTGYLFYTDAEISDTIANYAQDSYASAFSDSRFQIVKKAGAGTLKINVYITQVVPNDAFFGTLGNIPGPDWIITKPIEMGLHYIGESSGGAVAVETIISDSQTNKVVAVLATREKGTFALFNIDGFTMSGSGKRMVDTWATDLVSTLTQLKSGTKDLTAAKIYPMSEWLN